ncbi:MAG: DMT family transporter [Rhodocyclaceae bacterium]|nr:DMT family transporter [Rhodocyclaceae bacterium]
MQSKTHATAFVALFTGAIVWGLIWYPYRVLEQAGLSGVFATTATYAVALAGGILAFRSHWRALRPSPLLILIGLAAGACNFSYVLGMLHGQVMRVLLLFYLAPLWTVALSRLILKERLDRASALVLLLSVTGAAIMLWRPELGVPLPRVPAEWLGLASGFLFALGNVLARRAAHVPEEARVLAMFLGVALLGAILLFLEGAPALPPVGWSPIGLVLLLGIILLAVNLAAQYGLAHLPANRAAVILLFEPVVAALASWLLAGETMSPREWLGGALIACASLMSVRVGAGSDGTGAETRQS